MTARPPESKADAGRRLAPLGLEPLLEATGIEKGYARGLRGGRRLEVLSGASLVLWPGEVVGLVGENGSGKSTLVKILVGSLEADAGRVRRPDRVGYCPQEPTLYERLTCDEHLELFGCAYGMAPEAVVRSAEELYEALRFARYRDARVGELSGGTRAKLNLGVALLADPDLLLLDEPYAGFDWETYLRFWRLVEARRADGRSVLIVSHFVEDEARFDRVLRLEAGRVVVR